MTITKYQLRLNGQSIDFPNLEAVAAFKSANPEWSAIEAIVITEEVIEPKPMVPSEVPLWTIRTVLISMGLLSVVKAAIAGLPEGVQKIAAEQGIEYANTIRRDSPTTTFVQSVLGLTNQQVDEIFITALTVDA